MAPAQFFAGWYNGLSGEYNLNPTNILQCYQPSEDLTNYLYDSKEGLLRAAGKTGIEILEKLVSLYKTAIANCD